MISYATETKSPEPTFALGAEIEFEVAPGTNYARWDYMRPDNINIDLGPSGVWAKGVVVDAEEVLGGYPQITSQDIEFMNTQYIYVRFGIEGMVGEDYTGFPKSTNANYRDHQWNRKGFLRKKIVPVCVCGTEKVYGSGTNLHSFWCEKYQGD